MFELADGTIIADRKAVGERILGMAAQVRRRGAIARQPLGTYYGFVIELSGYEVADGEGGLAIATGVSILHSGEQRGFEISDKTRWNSLVGRIEASVGNLDTELAGVRGGFEADERRLPTFEARLGQDFPDAALLEDKLLERAELEADLANTKSEFEAENDAQAPDADAGTNEGDLLSQAA